MNNKKINIKKHLSVFFLTFASGFFLSDFLSKKQLTKLNILQQSLRIDILSLETQFSILTQAPCENLNESTLTKELYDISQKLTSVENNLGRDNPYFLQLKKYYSILELKHWLLIKRASKNCKLNLSFIIYFYADKKNCPNCQSQGLILSYFRKKYPFLRIYSFDWNLELSALQTLKSVYNLKEQFPILIVNDKVLYGFKNKENLEKILEKYTNLQLLEEATSTKATSTETTSSENKIK